MPFKARLSALLALASCSAACLLQEPARAAGDEPVAAELASLSTLSIEELLRTEVSSVLKHPSELAQAPAATTVLRREDIQRLGATTLPDLLRTVPGLHVAQIDGNKWGVSARGFNGFFGGKLLVLIDGRSIYNSIYSGVFWDAYDIALDDIARIEVVRGPGAALWGANAVNGVINIVTRSAHETQGGQATLAVGNVEKGMANVRWGSTTEEGGAWRLYARSRSRDDHQSLTGNGAGDTWRADRIGFRADSAAGSDTWMVNGEAYQGHSGGAPYPLSTANDISGQHLLGRLSRRLGDGSQLQVQSYVDHSWRREPSSGAVLEETVADVDLQHTVNLSPAHRLVWGGGWRQYRFDSVSSAKLSFSPVSSQRTVTNLFVQDEWTVIPETLQIIAGAKLERVPDHGSEWQPNLRAVWNAAAGHTLWAGTARAVRSPNQVDTAIRFNGPGVGPLPAVGNPAFRPERLRSLEAGWRVQLTPNLSSDVSVYQNHYKDLQTIEFDGASSMMYFNNAQGRTRGLEWALDWQAAAHWQLRGGFTLYREALDYSSRPAGPALISFQGGFPREQLFIRSLWDLSRNQRLDLTWRGVGPMDQRGVAGYGTFDLRWTRRLDRRSEVSLIGRNLLGPKHREFGDQPFFQETVLRRELSVVLSWGF